MYSKPERGVIRSVPKAECGLSDCVELFANASVTVFRRKKGETPGGGVAECRMTASYESGVVSISLRSGRPLMVSVRLDEMMALLQAAAAHAAGLGEQTKESAPFSQKGPARRKSWKEKNRSSLKTSKSEASLR